MPTPLAVQRLFVSVRVRVRGHKFKELEGYFDDTLFLRKRQLRKIKFHTNLFSASARVTGGTSYSLKENKTGKLCQTTYNIKRQTMSNYVCLSNGRGRSLEPWLALTRETRACSCRVNCSPP